MDTSSDYGLIGLFGKLFPSNECHNVLHLRNLLEFFDILDSPPTQCYCDISSHIFCHTLLYNRIHDVIVGDGTSTNYYIVNMSNGEEQLVSLFDIEPVVGMSYLIKCYDDIDPVKSCYVIGTYYEKTLQIPDTIWNSKSFNRNPVGDVCHINFIKINIQSNPKRNYIFATSNMM
jgi:hypothetical protein